MSARSEAAGPRIARFAVVQLEVSVGAQEVRALADPWRLGLREHVLGVRIAVVVASADARGQVFDTSAHDGLRERPDTGARADNGAAQPVVGLIAALGAGSEAEEVLARVVAPAGPAFDEQALVRKFREADAAFGGEVAPGGSRDPDVHVAVMVEQVAIAVAQTVGEPAAHGQTAELGVEPFTIEDEDGPILEEMEPALDVVLLMRVGFLGLLRAFGLQNLGTGGGLLFGLGEGGRRNQRDGDKPEPRSHGSSGSRDHANQPILPRLGPWRIGGSAHLSGRAATRPGATGCSVGTGTRRSARTGTTQPGIGPRDPTALPDPH